MPTLKLSSLFRREPAAPTLRERAATLRASVASRSDRPRALPAPGSAEAMAAFAEACREHSVRTNPPGGWPDLMRDGERIWTRHDLGKAMDAGEITPVEYARLYPVASERELQLEIVGHELNIGSLFALAYAGEYPLKVREPSENEAADDAELLGLTREWEAAASAYAQAIRDQGTISDGASAIETPPAREPHEQWVRLVQGWRERTGVDAAEAATAEALDILCEIEDRISAMPATTLAGLRLKARVAQRNEVAWPDGLGEGLVRDILAIGEPAVEADAKLLRLGRRFDVVSAREIAANESCTAAEREADRHMPRRPACLIYRASDAYLNVHQNRMMAEALDGREIRSTDVERLRRIMPMMHEVLRPIREGERAHVDHAGRKFDIVPHPEAQARAEEIVAAWDAWDAERQRILNEYVPGALDDAATDASDEAAGLAERIASLPARTAAGLRVKLRALAHYRASALPAEIPDLPDPDQLLSHSLWRDVQGESPAAVSADPREAGLVGMLDLASASLDDLQSLHDVADLVGGVAYATVWSARCKARGPGDGPNAAGKLMQWLGDALTDVETATNNEARRRIPTDNSERETRLEMLALPVIQNGDQDETEAFARELLAHVEAERQGC